MWMDGLAYHLIDLHGSMKAFPSRRLRTMISFNGQSSWNLVIDDTSIYIYRIIAFFFLRLLLNGSS